jgi:hypothetical protein
MGLAVPEIDVTKHDMLTFWTSDDWVKPAGLYPQIACPMRRLIEGIF